MYCSTEIKVRDVISVVTKSEENLLALADTAFKAGDYSESNKIFTQLIELNSNNKDYWIYKGLSIGWLSNLSSNNFQEMMGYIEKGISLIKTKEEENLEKLLIALHLLNISYAYFEMSTKYAIEFISVPSTTYEHIDRCKSIIEVLELAVTFDPNLSEASDLIVDISTRQFSISKTSPSEKEFFKGKALKYKNNNTPKAQLDRLNSSGCFIVTATFGNESNFIINEIRNFRSSFLSKKIIGLKIIRIYYKKGPFLAKFISHHQSLKILSFILFVIPVFIVSVLTRFFFKSN